MGGGVPPLSSAVFAAYEWIARFEWGSPPKISQAETEDLVNVDSAHGSFRESDSWAQILFNHTKV